MNTVAQISTVASCVHTAWPRSEQLWRDVNEWLCKFQNVKTESLSIKRWVVDRWNILFSLKSTAKRKTAVVSHLCYQENRPIKKLFLSHLSPEFRLAPYCGFTKTECLAVYPWNPPKFVNETCAFRTKLHFLRKWTAGYSQALAVAGLAASQMPWAEVEPDDGLDWRPRPSGLLCSPPMWVNV